MLSASSNKTFPSSLDLRPDNMLFGELQPVYNNDFDTSLQETHSGMTRDRHRCLLMKEELF